MFDHMTTEAIRIERNRAIATAVAHGADVPLAPTVWSRVTARITARLRRARSTEMAPVVALPTAGPAPVAAGVVDTAAA